MKLFLPLWFYLVMLVPGFSPLAFMKPYKKQIDVSSPSSSQSSSSPRRPNLSVPHRLPPLTLAGALSDPNPDSKVPVVFKNSQ